MVLILGLFSEASGADLLTCYRYVHLCLQFTFFSDIALGVYVYPFC